MEDRLFRALAVLRVVVLLNAVGLNAWRHDNFEHPVGGALVVIAMTGWTVVAIAAFRRPRWRTPWLLGADLALAVLALASSPLLKGEGFNATVPGFWIMGALLAWAIHWHVLGGLTAAVALSATDLLVRDHVTQANYGNVFLLLIGGPIVGYMCASLQRMAADRDRAERASAVSAERERLSRVVHDGVLQVLALAQRRGSEPEAPASFSELGRLAGEQERSLRALIRQQDTLVPAVAQEADLTGALEALVAARGPAVELVTPGRGVPMPDRVVTELTAAVGACLDNVRRHVGEDARAWVLLEAMADAVVVTVRDGGDGIPAGRLASAEAEGRLGVASSIRGRMADLGGVAVLDTGAWGTEWTLRVPR